MSNNLVLQRIKMVDLDAEGNETGELYGLRLDDSPEHPTF